MTGLIFSDAADWPVAAAAGVRVFRLERPANSLRDLGAWLVREKNASGLTTRFAS